MSSLRYQVFHAIRIGCRDTLAISAETGIERRAALNVVSKLRGQGLIEGGPGEYRIIVDAWVVDDDRRGRSPGSSIGRDRGVMLRRGDSPAYKPSPCLLAECWPEISETGRR